MTSVVFRAGATPFIGRRRELEALEALFTRGEKLVTVTGTAGVGKTRLAIEWASRSSFVFCDLSAAEDGFGICEAVASALGVPLCQGPLPRVVEALGHAFDGRGVVVLDPFDALVREAEAIVGRWQEADTRFLITSRERLRLPGEVVYELVPLACPDPAEPPTVEHVAASDAVKLFLDLAARVRPSLTLTAADAPAIAGIVRKLEGIPLAIELAAARTAVLGPRQLDERLGHGLQVIEGGPPGATGPRALRDALALSWNMLDPCEQAALAQCAVFRGGFTVEAAEAVIAPCGGRAVLEILQSLVGKSLLRVSEADADGARLGLYQSVQELAAEELERAGLLGQTLERHARYYVETATAWSREVATRGVLAPVDHLLVERQNLLAVAGGSLERSGSGDWLELGLRALVALVRTRWKVGHDDRYGELLEALLSRTGGTPIADDVFAEGVEARQMHRHVRGEAQESDLVELARALDAARRSGHELLACRLRLQQANCLWRCERVDEAIAMLEQAIADVRALGGGASEVWALGSLGVILGGRGQYERACRVLHEAASLAHRLGDEFHAGWVLSQLSLIYVDLGRPREAHHYLEQALELLRKNGQLVWLAWCEGLLGYVQHLEGRLPEAIGHYDRSAALCRRMGLRFKGAQSVMYGAIARAELGQWVEAEQGLRDAGGLHEAIGRRHVTAAARVYGAVVDAVRGRVEAARIALESVPPEHQSPAVLAPVLLARLHVALALAEESDARGDVASARAHRDEALERLRMLVDASSGAEYRFALRLVKLTAAGADLVDRLASAVDPAALLVHEDGDWFRAPRAAPVSCRIYAAPKRILGELTRRRIAAPGESIPASELVAHGWPGERLVPKAAAQRLHSAIAKLRRLGLRNLLLTTEGGYHLDPSVPVTLTTVPLPPGP